jgi:hypothetical protein
LTLNSTTIHYLELLKYTYTHIKGKGEERGKGENRRGKEGGKGEEDRRVRVGDQINECLAAYLLSPCQQRLYKCKYNLLQDFVYVIIDSHSTPPTP